MDGTNVNSLIIKGLSAKPVAFNPVLGKIANSAVAGLFMSQLLFWWQKSIKKDCIYKSVREFKDETCLTRSEQDRAIKIWSKLGVLRVENKGIPRTRHYYLDEYKFREMLDEWARENGVNNNYIFRD
jgi:hypothetical protein